MTTSYYVCLFIVSILGLINCYTINRLRVQNVAASISNNSKFRLFDTSISQMDVGEFKNLQFEKISIINDNICKYRVIGAVEAKDSNQYMKDYKEEVKKRGVLFPGFRAGKLPPAVMQDARRYIVCFGLEQLINALCNRNNLMVCINSVIMIPCVLVYFCRRNLNT